MVRRIHVAGAWRATPVYPRADLLGAPALRGPALVIDYGSTTLVPPGYRVSLDESGTLRIVRIENQ